MREPCTSIAVTGAYAPVSLDFLFVFFETWYKIFFFFCVLRTSMKMTRCCKKKTRQWGGGLQREIICMLKGSIVARGGLIPRQ